MGYGSYRASDWVKLRESRGLKQDSSVQEIFDGNELKETYDPKFISVRESCDSDDSPLSTPIILGFDVTGSMGYLAAEIAKNSLNKTVTELYDKTPVTNPHVMCAAFTGWGMAGALQVTQFEADIRVVEQLLDLKVGFGSNRYSYDSLVWYFAAKHTKIDSFEKRRKKGFIFCIGDEVCDVQLSERMSPAIISKLFGDKVPKKLDQRKLYDLASEKYEIFHIITGSKRAINSWNEFIPGRVAYIHESNIDCLSEVITSVMQVVNGADRKSVTAQWNGTAREVVQTALETIHPEKAAVNVQPEAEKEIKEEKGGWIAQWMKKSLKK